jgi:hypothetical protein
MDEPLREVGGDLLPATTPQAPQAPTSAVPASPVPSPAATPPSASPSAVEPAKSSRGKTTRSSRRAAREAEPELPTEVAEKAPAPQSQLPYPPEQSSTPPAPQPSLGESAKQFAKGFAHGVGAESRQIYNDTKELPSQLAKTGREILEDIHANRRVRALAPLVAMEHALRNASRKDVERIAHATVDAAKEWLEKPAYEKGESLGRATTAIASEVAIDVLTEGLGSVALLRKVEKVADAADHVRDAERGVGRLSHATHEVAREGSPLWSATRSKSAAENAFGHWTKHRSEFPEFDNAKQYAEAAKSMAASPPADALIKNRGTDSLIYHKATNTFVVKGADGAPRTMFRPADGLDYWKRQ